MKILSVTILFLISIVQVCRADKFIIGKPCPAFELKNMDYYKNKVFRPEQARGKWLLLDFFAMGCSGSFSALGKLDSLQRKLPGKLQVVLIGKNKALDQYPSTQLKTYYDQYQKKYSYHMAAGYDTSLFNKLNIDVTPFAVLVDPSGIVQSIFVPNAPSLSELIDFVNGKTLALSGEFKGSGSEILPGFDWEKPLLLQNNGLPEDSFLFRSIFTARLPAYAPNPSAFNASYGNRIQFINKTIAEYFYYAYGDSTCELPFTQSTSYGKISSVRGWDWSLTASDSINFLEKEYCYSLSLPETRAKTKVMQKILQEDLKTCFGLTARIEIRNMPCYVLVNNGDPNRFATKGHPYPANGDFQMGKLELRDVPMHFLVKQLWGRYRTPEPVIDETGITGQLDIDLDALYYDSLPTVINALKAIDLDLIKTTRPMKVIVIGFAEE